MQEAFAEAFPNVQFGLALATAVIVVLILIAALVALVVSIVLAISYFKYNRKQNSVGMTGQDIARRVLDDNGLTNIKVSATGSLLFGNSYSHYFKKVRLRRRTYQKKSVASMVMAVQKSALAVMDKEQDPDMKKRIRLTPVIDLGPLAFIPLVIIGVLLDYFVFSGSGTCTILFSVLGLAFYLFAFILSISVLKTERKAQARAIVIMKDDAIASDEEIVMAQKLFRLYNIEYVKNMVISLLELLYYVLQIVSAFSDKGGASFSSGN